jgi:hypothetical protein
MVIDEIKHAPRIVKRYYRTFASIIESVSFTKEAKRLAEIYMVEGNISQKQKSDAFHIAIASVNKIDILVSWNFKHIVNLNRIVLFNGVNMKHGYPTVEIRNPREIIHEKEI